MPKKKKRKPAMRKIYAQPSRPTVSPAVAPKQSISSLMLADVANANDRLQILISKLQDISDKLFGAESAGQGTDGCNAPIAPGALNQIGSALSYQSYLLTNVEELVQKLGDI